MATTFELISSVTVGSGGSSSIDFTSIPSTYKDLVIKCSARGTQTGTGVIDADVNVRFNGDTSSINSIRRVSGSGTAAASYSNSAQNKLLYFGNAAGNDATASTFGNTEWYIPNYAGSTNKSVSVDAVSENNGSAAWMILAAGLWASTAAINQVTLLPDSGTFLQYSTAYLYGVKNV